MGILRRHTQGGRIMAAPGTRRNTTKLASPEGLEPPLTVLETAVLPLHQRDIKMFATDRDIKKQMKTLTEDQLPKIQTELDELNKQYDLLLSARNFHVGPDGADVK